MSGAAGSAASGGHVISIWTSSGAIYLLCQHPDGEIVSPGGPWLSEVPLGDLVAAAEAHKAWVPHPGCPEPAP